MKTGILVGLAAPLLAAAPALAAEPQDEGAPAAQLEAVHVQGKSRSTRTEHRDSFTTSAMRTTTGLALSPKETPAVGERDYQNTAGRSKYQPY